jgi:hypothetical protein
VAVLDELFCHVGYLEAHMPWPYLRFIPWRVRGSDSE